jgi:hypothetical protein
VVYIDTERKFSEKRLIQILKHQVDGSTHSGINYAHLLNRVHVIRPETGVHWYLMP